MAYGIRFIVWKRVRGAGWYADGLYPASWPAKIDAEKWQRQDVLRRSFHITRTRVQLPD